MTTGAHESADKGTLLDVEDETSRQERLGRLFAAQSSTSNSKTSLPPSGPSLERKTYAVPPPSDLLSRLEAFLPAMKEANEALEKKVATEGPASVDIENIGSDDVVEPDSDDDAIGEDDFELDEENAPPTAIGKPYIEMNLGLGVFEERPPPDQGSSSSGLVVSESDEDSSDTESTTSSDTSRSVAAIVAEPDQPPAKKSRHS
ncbi:hypothetical protein FRB95_014384 [Tulasnella sp. JGI-2019a]|nr:hypothetical protein FRB95_014384 [Tulasnella sp. JGI-2019a]